MRVFPACLQDSCDYRLYSPNSRRDSGTARAEDPNATCPQTSRNNPQDFWRDTLASAGCCLPAALPFRQLTPLPADDGAASLFCARCASRTRSAEVCRRR